MKKLLAYPLSQTLYFLGDLISKPMSYSDYFAWLYPAYNNLMAWSFSMESIGAGSGD